MPERQTNIRIDTSFENVWIEHYTQTSDGEEIEDSERITVRLTGNVALDALMFYNEFMRINPKATLEHLKRDIQHLEEMGYDEWNEEGVHGHPRHQTKKHRKRQDDSDEAASLASR